MKGFLLQFQTNRKGGQTICTIPARRVALVKQRVRENTRRRQRREAISLSAFCLMLFTALAGAAAITALCIRLRNRKNQKKGGTNKPARYEQEEKSQ